MEAEIKRSIIKEQIEYLKEHKKEICKEYYGMKVGFDLNLTYHFGSLAYFELKKVYSYVPKEIFYSEKLTSEIFGEEMDSCWIQPGANIEFSLKDCMKTEAKMVLLTDFVMDMVRNNKKYYPSEIKRKEKVINNAHKRACKVIDLYFEGRDIVFSEVKDVFDHYEIIVSDQGNVVDFHFGRHGFSLNKQAASYKILEYVEKEREKYQVAADHLKENEKVFTNYREYLINNDLLSKRQAEKVTSHSIGSYELQNDSQEKVIGKLNLLKENLEHLITFLGEIKKENVVLPDRAEISIFGKEIKIDYLTYQFTKKTNDFIKQLKNYLKVEELIEKVRVGIESNEIRCFATYKDNVVKFDATHIPRLSTVRLNEEYEPEQLQEMINRDRKRKPVAIILKSENGKLYRDTGEEVLTSEVIQFEIMEKLRSADKEYFISVERAREMLQSVLSPEEEKLMETENLTIIEGQKNYYALINRTYNNVVKIPKNATSVDEIKALCIHPEDSTIPMYDGFASIVLSVKSGDEDYILENSNEFVLQKKVKEKVLNVFNSFIPEQLLSFV